MVLECAGLVFVSMPAEADLVRRIHATFGRGSREGWSKRTGCNLFSSLGKIVMVCDGEEAWVRLARQRDCAAKGQHFDSPQQWALIAPGLYW